MKNYKDVHGRIVWIRRLEKKDLKYLLKYINGKLKAWKENEDHVIKVGITYNGIQLRYETALLKILVLKNGCKQELKKRHIKRNYETNKRIRKISKTVY